MERIPNDNKHLCQFWWFRQALVTTTESRNISSVLSFCGRIFKREKWLLPCANRRSICNVTTSNIGQRAFQAEHRLRTHGSMSCLNCRDKLDVMTLGSVDFGCMPRAHHVATVPRLPALQWEDSRHYPELTCCLYLLLLLLFFLCFIWWNGWKVWFFVKQWRVVFFGHALPVCSLFLFPFFLVAPKSCYSGCFLLPHPFLVHHLLSLCCLWMNLCKWTCDVGLATAACWFPPSDECCCF